MKGLNRVDEVLEVSKKLKAMGLNFPVEMIETGDRDGEYAVKVTYGEGIFGSHIETLNRFFDVDLFLSFFKGRVNYLKLSEEERAAITVHPQVWEAEFLSK